MERDEIIRMARGAGFLSGCITLHSCESLPFVAPVSATNCFVELQRFAALVEAAATEKANERANASWASMCEKMVAAEREAMISEAAKLGWAMKNDDPFEDAVAEVARIREMEN